MFGLPGDTMDKLPCTSRMMFIRRFAMRSQFGRLMLLGMAAVMVLAGAPGERATAQDAATIDAAVQAARAGNSTDLATLLANAAANPTALAVITDAVAIYGDPVLIAAVLGSGGNNATGVTAVQAAMAKSLVATRNADLAAQTVALLVAASGQGSRSRSGLEALGKEISKTPEYARLVAKSSVLGALPLIGPTLDQFRADLVADLHGGHISSMT